MNDIIASGYDTGDDQIPQRMQIVMHHGIDSRNIEVMMESDEKLSEQAAGDPCQQERQHHLGLCHPDQWCIEAEDPRIDPKQQKQRDEGKQNLVQHILRLHFRE